MKKSFEMNMCEGAIFKKIIIYSIPLIASNVLQLLFNAADVAVLGKFLPDGIGSTAQAAVGSTGALINLLVGLFVGLSVGANVIVAKCFGQNNLEKSHRVVGVSMLISVVCGVVLSIIGILFSRTFLKMTDCPKEVLDYAVLYMQLYFLGMPIMMVYNFSSSILRAVGDTVRPLIFLSIGGVVNVGFNIMFITVFGMTVDGVAIATVISQLISATLTVITLLKSDGFAKFSFKYFKFYGKELKEICAIGVPSGLQGCLFSISNVIIQKSINSFGEVAIAGNSIASNIDGFIYNAMYAVALASVAFVSQNMGAGNYKRIKTVILECVGIVTVMGLIISSTIMLLCRPICSIYSNNNEAIEYAIKRLIIVATLYFLCGLMDVGSNSLRGLGKSTLAMIISLTGSCLLRIIWLETLFKLPDYHSLNMVYVTYPISWFITAIVHYVFIVKEIKKKEKAV